VTPVRVVGGLVQGVGVVAGLLWWGWSMAIWYDLLGTAGLAVGALTISDLALPFAVYAATGGWPLFWLGLMVAAMAAIAVGGGLREWPPSVRR
jgi:hypothetical protein